ncbi:Tim44 domain-containing protein [Chthonobacter rhizosphaerae]|uniref:Tim44 domain-containing protein n=1 Tax=Chthonobacter rhizosphaerae TaxID=2735553 RepID=UPI0015EF5050|nr:Tim44 domain-containing protein [Chthonobacter rhizosphaerae]
MSRLHRSRQWLAMLAIGLAVSLVTVDFAEARRGGSFGSRGARTFSTPAPTPTMPRQTAPVERSMTPAPQANQPTAATRQPGATQSRPGGLFGGFGRGILGGLLFGGLLGMLFGGGFGGLAGILGLIVQVALIALVVMLVMRFFRGRSSSQPGLAGAGAPYGRTGPDVSRPGMTGATVSNYDRHDRSGARRMFDIKRPVGGGSVPPVGAAPKGPSDEIGIRQTDLDTFERLLTEVQTAYGREDFAALRAVTTPEVMSYLAEELGENGAKGVKNEVSDVRLLQGDLSEAWREGDTEYATVAMRYESRDVTRDRATGRIVEGDADHPTEATELWTFVRPRGGAWKLSAIQT